MAAPTSAMRPPKRGAAQGRIVDPERDHAQDEEAPDQAEAQPAPYEAGDRVDARVRAEALAAADDEEPDEQEQEDDASGDQDHRRIRCEDAAGRLGTRGPRSTTRDRGRSLNGYHDASSAVSSVPPSWPSSPDPDEFVPPRPPSPPLDVPPESAVPPSPPSPGAPSIAGMRSVEAALVDPAQPGPLEGRDRAESPEHLGGRGDAVRAWSPGR